MLKNHPMLSQNDTRGFSSSSAALAYPMDW
jgi:hypothetical protein